MTDSLDTVGVIAYPKPLDGFRVSRTVQCGGSIDEILGLLAVDHGIHPLMIPCLRATLLNPVTGNETVVPYVNWRSVRPKAGSVLLVKAVPQGRGGGGVLRVFASLAIAVAAIYFAPAIVGGSMALAGGAAAAVADAIGMTTFTAALAIGAVSVGITLVGSALINAILPTPSAANRESDYGSSSLSTPTYAITGLQNRSNPYGPIPKIYGRRKVFPVVAASLYHETQGSSEYIRGLFCFGYGPLQIEDIRIGTTPISAFTDVEYQVRQGLPSDTPLTLYSNSVMEESLNVKLMGWVDNDRLTQKNTNEVIVDITCPRGLTEYLTNGKRRSVMVRVRVQIKRLDTGHWYDPITLTLNDDSTSAVRGSVRWVSPSGASQFLVRVTRYKDDVTSAQILDDVWWTSLKSVTNTYPIQNINGLALLAIRIKATEQLNGTLNTLNAICTSMLPVYDGSSWSSPVATTNPAWAYCDVLKGPASNIPFSDGQIDLASIRSWALACEGVSGWGYNAVHDRASTVETVLREICASARAKFIMRSGKFSVLRDSAQEAVWQHFTPLNSWGFKATRTFTNEPHGLKGRWVNPDTDWQEDELIAYSEGYDANNAALFEQVDMLAVTNSGQVWRDLRYHLAANKLRPAVYELYTDVEHLVCEPGDLIRVAYDVPLWGQWQAAVKSVSLNGGGECTSILLDGEVTMTAGKTYVVRIRLSDNTTVLAQVVTALGASSELAFTVPLSPSSIPEVGDIVMFGETGQESARFIVKSIHRGEDLSARIVFVDEAPEIHSWYSGALPPFSSNISLPAPVEFVHPAQPVFTSIESTLIRASGAVRTAVLCSVAPSAVTAVAVSGVQVQYKLDIASQWTDAPTVQSAIGTSEIVGMVDGSAYNIRIRSVSRYGLVSEWNTTTYAPDGFARKPSDVQSFAINVLGTTAYLTWDPVADLDASHYKIKFTPSVSGATWGGSAELVSNLTHPQSSITVPAMNGTYLIKAYDSSGYESINASTILCTTQSLDGFNVEAVVTENPSWSGTKSGCVVVDGTLRLASGDTMDSWADVDSLYLWDLGEVPYRSEGVYYCANAVDLGNVFTSRVTAAMIAYGAEAGLPIDSWADVDNVSDFDGIDPSDWSATLQIRSTNDDPGASPTWSAWQNFIVGDYSARAFQWRILLTTGRSTLTPVIEALVISVDMPDRVAGQYDVPCPAGGKTVSFGRDFRTTPAIAVNIQGGTTGDYYVVSGQSASGFTLQVFNSGGVPVERTFDWIARGYGYLN